MPPLSNGNSFIYSGLRLAAGTLLLEGALQCPPAMGVFDTHPVQRAGTAL